jgi:hypothetical protein
LQTQSTPVTILFPRRIGNIFETAKLITVG